MVVLVELIMSWGRPPRGRDLFSVPVYLKGGTCPCTYREYGPYCPRTYLKYRPFRTRTTKPPRPSGRFRSRTVRSAQVAAVANAWRGCMCNGCVPLAIGIQFSTFVGVCLRQLLCLLVVGSPAIRFRGFPDFGSCICVVFSYWAYPGFCFFPPGV